MRTWAVRYSDLANQPVLAILHLVKPEGETTLGLAALDVDVLRADARFVAYLIERLQAFELIEFVDHLLDIARFVPTPMLERLAVDVFDDGLVHEAVLRGSPFLSHQ